MATISSTGVGSGLDVESIITKLTAVERKPITTLQTQAATIQTKISTYGQIRSLVSELNSAARTLTLDRGWNTTKLSSSTSNVAVAATGSPVAGDYNVEVTGLASAQTSASKKTFSTSDVMGTDGKLKFTNSSWGTTGYEVNIDATMNLSQVVSAINSTDGLSEKVQASVITTNDGTQRMVIRSRSTGADSSFKVSVTDASGGDTSGLSTKLAELGAGFETTQKAANATMKFNGVEVASSTNVFDSVIPGMTITAGAEGKSVISVTADKEATRENIKKFVEAYNSLNTFLADSTKFEKSTSSSTSDTVGPLQGDSTVVSLQSKLRMMTQSSITANSGVMRRLSDLGIEMQRGGALSVNDTKLTAALNKPEEVKAVFAQATSSSSLGGIATRFKSLTDTVIALDGDINRRTDALNASLERNSKQQAAIETRATALATRMRTQYSALDTKMASISSMSSYVSGMISALNAANSSK